MQHATTGRVYPRDIVRWLTKAWSYRPRRRWRIASHCNWGRLGTHTVAQLEACKAGRHHEPAPDVRFWFYMSAMRECNLRTWYLDRAGAQIAYTPFREER